MIDDRLMRTKDFWRLAAAAGLTVIGGVGLQLLLARASLSCSFALLFMAWLLSRWPFARLRLRLRQTLFSRRASVDRGYFRN